jgi:hypothetical protein
MREGKPVLAIVGHGRAGKDTASLWLRDHTALRFAGGASWSAAPYMAQLLGKTPEEAYRDRHQDRLLWMRKLNELRERDGPTALVRLCLGHSDIVCGLRNRAELVGGRAEGLLDLIVWVDRQVPDDPTVEFDIYDADVVVLNHTSLDDFYRRLRHLANALQILRSGL